MKISVRFAGNLSRSEKKGIRRVMKTAKTLDDIGKYTRKHGIWMMSNAYYKTIIFYKF